MKVQKSQSEVKPWLRNEVILYVSFRQMTGSAEERPLAGGEETGKAAGDEEVQKGGASVDPLTAE